MMKQAPAEVDVYFHHAPEAARERLILLRAMILELVPEAKEFMKYGVPTWVWHGNLIHVGAYKGHIGIYPAPREAAAFAEELKSYGGGKGTLQVPHKEPLPLDLIRRIILFRKQIMENKATKGAARKRQPKG